MQLGAIKVLLNAFFAKLDPHPPPRNASNVEPLHLRNAFFQKIWHPHPLPSALRNTWMAPNHILHFTNDHVVGAGSVCVPCIDIYTMNFPTKVLVFWWRYAISCESWPGSWECWCMHHSWAVARVQQRQCDSRQKLPQSADRAGMGRRVAWRHQRLLHDICLSGIEAVTR